MFAEFTLHFKFLKSSTAKSDVFKRRKGGKMFSHYHSYFITAAGSPISQIRWCTSCAHAGPAKCFISLADLKHLIILLN